MTDQQKVREDAFREWGAQDNGVVSRIKVWNAAWQAALAHASGAGAEECSVDDHVAGDGKLVSEAVAWMTHHEPPMLFPTREEAAAYCADDEQPLPLYTHPARSAEDATTNPHESSSKLVDAAVLAELTAWLTREMPAGTIIGSPEWLAKRIAGRVHIAIDQAIAGWRGDV